jgi:hypothetical protein
MTDRYTQVVVLCEDIMHLNFVRRYLIARGIDSRRIRGNVTPAGRGAGSQYVIEKYPAEVKALRSRAYLRAGLVAVCDADTHSVKDRLRHFDGSLAKSGQPARGETERIALLVPKRNVETWVFHLLGNDVDEDSDYKRRVTSPDLKKAIDAFSNVCPSRVADIAVPSLQRACEELTSFLGHGA